MKPARSAPAPQISAVSASHELPSLYCSLSVALQVLWAYQSYVMHRLLGFQAACGLWS